MAEHENASVIRRSYEAFAKGDMASLAETFSRDVVWHLPGHHPLAGEYRSADAVFAAFARAGELSDGSLAIEVHDVVANDEHVVALTRETGSRQGKQLDARMAEIFHVSNGKIVEFWSFTDDQYEYDQFWS